MSSVRTLDAERLRTRRIIFTAAFTAVTVAFLLLKDTSAAPVTEHSDPAAAGVPSDPAEAQTAYTARPTRPQEE